METLAEVVDPLKSQIQSRLDWLEDGVKTLNKQTLSLYDQFNRLGSNARNSQSYAKKICGVVFTKFSPHRNERPILGARMWLRGKIDRRVQHAKTSIAEGELEDADRWISDGLAYGRCLDGHMATLGHEMEYYWKMQDRINEIKFTKPASEFAG